jgi:hypothetical protein
MQFWNELEGKLLAGTYPLTTLLRTEGDQAWFASHAQQTPVTAFVAKGAQEDQLVANLEAVSRIKHPNTVSIEQVGRDRLDDTAVVYAILEATEEGLAGVLRQRALTTEETAKLAESLAAALSKLHENGLLHGRVAAANVFALGETVKLRSDCIYQATGSKDDPETYGQDIGDLGALIFECLTRRQLTAPDDPAIARLATPFGAIVENAVTGKWSLADISAALKKPTVEARQPAPVIATPPAAPRPAPAKPVEPVKAKVAAPVIAASPAAPAAKKTDIRIFAAIAILALIAVGWYFYRGKQNATPAPQQSAPVATETPASPPPAPVSATPPVAPKEKPSSAKEAAPATSAATNADGEKHTVWRVVVYAFGHEEAAKRKVDGLLESNPELKPEVFTANGHGPYLVTVGGPMTKDEAFRLRDKVVSTAGLPADSYAQNYSH